MSIQPKDSSKFIYYGRISPVVDWTAFHWAKWQLFDNKKTPKSYVGFESSSQVKRWLQLSDKKDTDIDTDTSSQKVNLDIQCWLQLNNEK